MFRTMAGVSSPQLKTGIQVSQNDRSHTLPAPTGLGFGGHMPIAGLPYTNGARKAAMQASLLSGAICKTCAFLKL